MITSITLFDPADVARCLMPVTATRPVSHIRRGIMTIREKWEMILPGEYSVKTADARMQSLFNPEPDSEEPGRLWIAGNVCPTPEFAAAVAALLPGDGFSFGDKAIAWNTTPTRLTPWTAPLDTLTAVTDIFAGNDPALCLDFEMITRGRESQPLDSGCRLIGDPSRLFIEEGATILGNTINVTGGPVYIGRDACVMEGVNIRGSLALLDHAQINMGAKIYGGTTIGPHCKVGGEVNNVVFQGYSNKAHDGFLGNAVIGEWCNLGAGCVSSNLKNNYTEPRLWNYASGRFEPTGMQFCGLIMGDHSKAGINTMFNTATMVGVGCNVYGSGFPRTFVPSFSIGGSAGFSRLPFAKFADTARRVMARRHVELTPELEMFYHAIYDGIADE